MAGLGRHEVRLGVPDGVQDGEQKLQRERVVMFLLDVNVQQLQHAAFEVGDCRSGVLVLGFLAFELLLFAENGGEVRVQGFHLRVGHVFVRGGRGVGVGAEIVHCWAGGEC